MTKKFNTYSFKTFEDLIKPAWGYKVDIQDIKDISLVEITDTTIDDAFVAFTLRVHLGVAHNKDTYLAELFDKNLGEVSPEKDITYDCSDGRVLYKGIVSGTQAEVVVAFGRTNDTIEEYITGIISDSYGQDEADKYLVGDAQAYHMEPGKLWIEVDLEPKEEEGDHE